MAYMESNEPYNPIPGLAAGAFIGGGMTGLAAAGATSAVNFNRAGRERVRTHKVKEAEKRLEKMNNAAMEMQEKAFEPRDFEGGRGQNIRPKNGQNQTLKPGSTARNYFDMRDNIRQEEMAKQELMNKKIKPKITGGRKAGIIGGTALVGSIIGGTAGVVGNYN